jgi:hypothetical protein
MKWLIVMILAFLYASLIEYIAHKWTMHKPGLGKIPLWEEHAIQHHAKHRMDVNIVLSAFTVFLAASPLLFFCFWLGWWWALIVMIGCMLYAAIWSELHAAYHEVGKKWITKFPLYKTWRNHHLKHHEHPNKNFGTLFLWVDWIFGTKI